MIGPKKKLWGVFIKRINAFVVDDGRKFQSDDTKRSFDYKTTLKVLDFMKTHRSYHDYEVIPYHSKKVE